MAKRAVVDFIDLMGRVVADPETGCWIYVGSTSGDPEPGKTGRGYGRVSYRGQTWAAHRLSFILSGRKLAPHQQLDHVKKMGCRHRLCIRPEHLEPVSHRENCKRRDRALRQERRT